MLSAKGSQVAVTHQLLSLFIPETEGKRFEAGEQRNGWHSLKQWFRFVAPLQIVIGNPRAQMMNVMESNVAREPLQDLGQFVE